ANYGGNTVSVLLGNGDGSFRTEQTFAVGSYPNSVAGAGVNGGGPADPLPAHHRGNHVSAALGNANSSYPRTPPPGAGPPHPPRPTCATATATASPIASSWTAAAISSSARDCRGPTTRSPPVTLNDKKHLDRLGHLLLNGLPSTDSQGEDRPARDLTVLRTGT